MLFIVNKNKIFERLKLMNDDYLSEIFCSKLLRYIIIE